MAKSLVVNKYTFEYPENRDNPGWGEEAAAWAEAVSAVLQEVNGNGDITQSIATIQNIGTNVPINGFFIDPAVVLGAVCEYSIYRKITTGTGESATTEERVEVGQLFIGHKPNSGFEIVQVGGGTSGVTLTIESSGQMKYTSDPMSGDNYEGYIKFRARALTKRT